MHLRFARWNPDDIVAGILQLHAQGELLHKAHISRRHSDLYSAADRHMGGWRQAIEAAGLDYSTVSRRREWSKQRVVSEIRRVKRAGMNFSSTRDVRANFRSLHAAAVKRFGSWAAALNSAGLGDLYHGEFPCRGRHARTTYR